LHTAILYNQKCAISNSISDKLKTIRNMTYYTAVKLKKISEYENMFDMYVSYFSRV
jgi:hypothetical protein